MSDWSREDLHSRVITPISSKVCYRILYTFHSHRFPYSAVIRRGSSFKTASPSASSSRARGPGHRPSLTTFHSHRFPAIHQRDGIFKHWHGLSQESSESRNWVRKMLNTACRQWLSRKVICDSGNSMWRGSKLSPSSVVESSLSFYRSNRTSLGSNSSWCK
jgi:hypothetical protein